MYDSESKTPVNTTAMSTANQMPPLEAPRKSSASTKERIRLKGVEVTMLYTTRCKARDSESPNPILGDPYAGPLLDSCDVNLQDSDFKEMTDKRWVDLVLKRTKQFDQWCQEFIDAYTAKNEPITVLHLACGLDCRHLRVKRGPNVRWIDLDRPLVVDLRKRLISTGREETNDTYALRTLIIGTDATWLRDIPDDRPTLIIAEGLFMYLEAHKSEQAIRDVVDYFGNGEIVMDSVGPISTKMASRLKVLQKSRTPLFWPVEEPNDVLDLHPNLRLIARRRWKEYLEHGHPPFFGEYLTWLVSLVPSFKNNHQLWRFGFEKKASGVPDEGSEKLN